jgi:hypothetical protein
MPSTTMEDREKNHGMLALMLDSRIKHMHRVTSCLGLQPFAWKQQSID